MLMLHSTLLLYSPVSDTLHGIVSHILKHATVSQKKDETQYRLGQECAAHGPKSEYHA
jgi:hypothetical protein